MRIAELSLCSGPGAPGVIRAAVEQLAQLSPDIRADIRLLAGQLATSPEVIGPQRGGAALALRIDRDGRVVRVELRATQPEAGARHQVAAVVAGPPLLARVCDRWGMTHEGATASVWFEIDDPPAAEPSLCTFPEMPAAVAPV